MKNSKYLNNTNWSLKTYVDTHLQYYQCLNQDAWEDCKGYNQQKHSLLGVIDVIHNYS